MVIDNIKNKLPDASVENEISRMLREVEPQERQACLEDLLTSNDVKIRLSGLRILKRVKVSKQLALAMFELGLSRADAHEMKFWIASISDVIGLHNVISYLNLNVDRLLGNIVRVWYELRVFCSASKNCDRSGLDKLATAIELRIEHLNKNDQEYWTRLKGLE